MVTLAYQKNPIYFGRECCSKDLVKQRRNRRTKIVAIFAWVVLKKRFITIFD